MDTKPSLYYQKGSRYIEDVIKNCSTLQIGYQPTTLWGKNGHVQTAMFGTLGRPSVPELPSQRFSVVAQDGSTLFYDVFEPSGNIEPSPDLKWDIYTVFVCPGINNSSESSYVRAFAVHCVEMGYRVVVFNHLGALKAEKLTARRIFSYGGTEDMALIFADVCERYPHTKFMGCGFSLGACILVRFMGEKKERRQKFVCMASLCQGYDPFIHLDYMYDWKNMRRLYSFQISRFHKKLISRHKHALFPPMATEQPSSSSSATSAVEARTAAPNESEETEALIQTDQQQEQQQQQLPVEYFNGFPTEITHSGHNSNGCSLDRRKCLTPDERSFWSSTSMVEMDEAYTRRVLGFESVEEMYRWISCEELLNQIDDLPTLLVNSLDDPCIVDESHVIPKTFAENQSKSVFVLTQYGGHLGFYEGGVVPNRLSWIDRLFVEFADACVQANRDPFINNTIVGLCTAV